MTPTAIIVFLSFVSMAAKPPQPPTDHLDPVSAMVAIVRSSPQHMAQKSTFAVSWDPVLYDEALLSPEYKAHKDREWLAMEEAETHMREGRLQMVSNVLSEFLYSDYAMESRSLELWLDANLMMGKYWDVFYLLAHNPRYARLDPRLALRGVLAASHLGYSLPQVRQKVIMRLINLERNEQGTLTALAARNLPTGTSPMVIEYLCSVVLAQEEYHRDKIAGRFYAMHAVELYPETSYGLWWAGRYLLGSDYAAATSAFERAMSNAHGESFARSLKRFHERARWYRDNPPPSS